MKTNRAKSMVRLRNTSRISHITIIASAILINGPMIFTKKLFFMDWVNNYWLLKNAGGGYPQFFMKGSALGLLNAFPAYYGGGIFNLIYGINSVFINNLILTYRLTYFIGGLAVTYGFYLLAISRRIPNLISSCIAVIAGTSPYLITNEYARGDFGEYLAYCFFVLLIGSSSFFYFTSKRVEKFAALTLIIFSTYVFVSSHVLTFILGSFFLLLTFLVMLNRIRFRTFQKDRRLQKHLLVHVLAVALALLPAIPYISLLARSAGKTAVSHLQNGIPAVPQISGWSEIFFPVAHTDKISTTPGLSAQPANLLFILIFIGFYVKARQDGFLKTLVRVSPFLILGITSYLITSYPGLWPHLPFYLQAMQFPYRYVSYLSTALLFICVEIYTGLKYQIKDSHTLLLRRFVIFSACGAIILAVLQIEKIPSHPEYPTLESLSIEHPPVTWYAGQYSYAFPGPLPLTIPTAQVIQSVTSTNSRDLHLIVKCSGPAELILPTFAAPPLISINGGRFVGTTIHGDLVVRIDSCHGNRGELTLSQNTFLPAPVINWMLKILLLLSFSLILLSNRILFKRNAKVRKKNFARP